MQYQKSSNTIKLFKLFFFFFGVNYLNHFSYYQKLLQHRIQNAKKKNMHEEKFKICFPES